MLLMLLMLLMLPVCHTYATPMPCHQQQNHAAGCWLCLSRSWAESVTPSLPHQPVTKEFQPSTLSSTLPSTLQMGPSACAICA